MAISYFGRDRCGRREERSLWISRNRDPAFMKEVTRNPVALMHRLVVYSVRPKNFIYTANSLWWRFTSTIQGAQQKTV